jgi:DNA-binding NarL/FixJ family response regulator
MTVQVAVASHLPMYTRGLVATLGDHGHVADATADVLEWARRRGPIVIFLALAHEEDWTVLHALLAVRADAAVVGVIADPDVRDFTRAVSAGAVGVMALDADSVLVVDVLHGAMRGQCVVPIGIMRSLAADAANAGRPVTEVEVTWLRKLAAGTTVAPLAKQAATRSG